MRIFYYLSQYVSHLTAGLDYAGCLVRMGHEVCTNLAREDENRLLRPAGSIGSVSEDFTAARRSEERAAGHFPQPAPALASELIPALTSPLSTEHSPNRPPESLRGEASGPLRPLPVARLPAAQRAAAEHCDLFILHEDPLAQDGVYAAFPFLPQRRVVAYAAWENEILAPQYIAPLKRVAGVWTCSDFSRRAIAPHVEHCRLLPHLVERKTPRPADLAWGRELLAQVRGENPEAYVFFSVIDAVNPRKNLKGLLTAFSLLRKQTSRPVRLLLKQYRLSLDLRGQESVVSLDEHLSPGRMAALHVLIDAYVSAHHAEGWGLGLSSAMAYGKPVIATGYSGNMQYMNAGNSLPVDYRLVPVPREMTELVPLFRPEMRWADPDLGVLAREMRRAAEGRLDPALAANAAAIARRFGPQAIMARLRELLHELP